jgi:hypothetical protein
MFTADYQTVGIRCLQLCNNFITYNEERTSKTYIRITQRQKKKTMFFSHTNVISTEFNRRQRWAEIPMYSLAMLSTLLNLSFSSDVLVL